MSIKYLLNDTANLLKLIYSTLLKYINTITDLGKEMVASRVS